MRSWIKQWEKGFNDVIKDVLDVERGFLSGLFIFLLAQEIPKGHDDEPKEGHADEVALRVPEQSNKFSGAAELALWAQTVLATTPLFLSDCSAASR